MPNNYLDSIERERAKLNADLDYVQDKLSREQFDSEADKEFTLFMRRWLLKFNDQNYLSFPGPFRSIPVAYWTFRGCMDDSSVSIVPTMNLYGWGLPVDWQSRPRTSPHWPRTSTFTFNSGELTPMAGVADIFVRPFEELEASIAAGWKYDPLQTAKENIDNLQESVTASGKWKLSLHPVFIPGETSHPDVYCTNDFGKLNKVLDWLDAKRARSDRLVAELDGLREKFHTQDS